MLALAPQAVRAQAPLQVLDVPFITQTEALCGGAAAAMVLRFWGERGVSAESFASLVDTSVSGIRTDALVADLQRRGWVAQGVDGSDDLLARELVAGRPVIALVEDRPGAFHYVVVVAATPEAVLFHDPARAPFRGLRRDEFSRRWVAARRWMAVVTPPAGGVPRTTGGVTAGPNSAETQSASPDRCQVAIEFAARSASAGNVQSAEVALTAGACSAAATFRELAGLRAIERRWPQAEEMAAAALAIDPADAASSRVLAAARFIQGDRVGALTAWNTLGEPKLDSLQFDGMARTRLPVASRAAGISAGDLVTPSALLAIERRLAALPSLSSVAVEFVPLPQGLAEVRARATERPLVPRSVPVLIGIGAGAVFARTANVPFGAPLGAGDRLDLQWRFWQGWPRVSLDYSAPAPWGGVWAVGGSWEKQPFDAPALATQERRSARVSWASWVGPFVRVSVRTGADRWASKTGLLGVTGLGAQMASGAERVRAQVDVDRWWGRSGFGSAQGIVRLRSSNARLGPTLLAQAGGGTMGEGSPADIWFGGDTGRLRPVPLRAHRLVVDGVMRTERIGRSIVHASVEGQYWWRTSRLRVAAAAFADGADLRRRAFSGSRQDIDVGTGVRLGVPGSVGTLRVDVARGLINPDVRVSVGFEP